ncbi:hypothetical protein PO909_030767, partial [Leuciscus waleckii]
QSKNTGCQSSHPSRLCLNHVIDSNTAEITDSLSLLTRVSDYDVFEEIRVRHGQPVLYQPVLALLKWLLEAKTAEKACVIFASAKPALFSPRREGTINTSSSSRSTSHVPPSPRTQNRRGCGLHRKFAHLTAMCQVNVRRQIIMSLDVKVLLFARHYRRIIIILNIQTLY